MALLDTELRLRRCNSGLNPAVTAVDRAAADLRLKLKTDSREFAVGCRFGVSLRPFATDESTSVGFEAVEFPGNSTLFR